jgi:NADPH2:quinone reductase
MKAVLCKTHGPPETLVVEELPDPTPGPGEVVVDVAFASLNFFDTLIIENKYQLKPALPFSPGGELSGRVAAVGEGVQGLEVGDRVAANTGFGACRTKVVVKASRLVPVPDGLADEAAAGLMIAYGTSLYALKNRAELKSGETLAVLGAAGGAGLAAVEIGKALGARVIACASSAEKLDFAKSRGAEMTLDYSVTDLKEGLRELTGGKGADVIYDPVGGDLAEAALRSIAWKGRYLVIGFAAGQIPKFPMNLALASPRPLPRTCASSSPGPSTAVSASTPRRSSRSRRPGRRSATSRTERRSARCWSGPEPRGDDGSAHFV